MSKVDLHVHSKYSEHPSEWFLQRLGANESYIEPEFVFRQAKARGMTYVTLTDHNRIEGAQRLLERHPGEVFLGVESTAYFPEDGCKVHVLVYGLTESEFQDVQHLRQDIYQLRDFLRSRDLACSVAHATYSENGKIDLPHLEKLILLFDVFEAINGTRNRMNNQGWTEVLTRLTPGQIEVLRRRHGIEPWSETPWLKGFTGGSDDHAGFFIGQTHTASESEGIPGFLEALKRKRTVAVGRHNDYRSFAFALYKIAYDFSKAKSSRSPGSLLSALHELVFENKALGLRDRLRLGGLRLQRQGREEGSQRHLVDLMDTLRAAPEAGIDEKLPMVYDKLAAVSDDLLRTFLSSCQKDLSSGNLTRLVMSLSAFLPGIFLAVPFFTTLKHMYQGRDLMDRLHAAFEVPPAAAGRKVLWFTDTLTDINGVSATLSTIARMARPLGHRVRVAAALTEREQDRTLPPDLMRLPTIHLQTQDLYPGLPLRVPSLLRSLQMIQEFDPDEIVLSTPGPVGLLGLLAAHLLQVRKVGIYHTDFRAMAQALIPDEAVVDAVERLVRWFYAGLDEVRVPSRAYRRVLVQRGYPEEKLKPFPRGIDPELFKPRFCGKHFLKQKYEVPEGITLLYVGRISQEKNLDFLAELYRRALAKVPDLNLVLTGDGPYLPALRKLLPRGRRVVYTLAVPRETLPEIYSAADLFLYPSHSDTFGMAVLEAQACGLPAVVADAGGPQEIIDPGRTGWVARVRDLGDWLARIEEAVHLLRYAPERYHALRQAARERSVRRYRWPQALAELLGADPEGLPPRTEDAFSPAGLSC